ncbi:MAG: PIN domain-containing protein [Mycobacteriales bacterium]|nr:PIN domain-containing protein [Mycobacteriales bacterium]
MIALDASVLVAHFSAGDEHHADATSVLDAGAAEGFLLHTMTLTEVLVGGARVGRAAQLLSDITAMGVAVAPRDDDEPLRLAELRVATGLKLPDCCVLDTAVTHGARLATFDRSLAEAARRIGVVVLN